MVDDNHVLSWLDIESFPGNGDFFICWSERHGFSLANQPGHRERGNWHFLDGRWCGGITSAAHATHYLDFNLPPPPESEAQS